MRTFVTTLSALTLMLALAATAGAQDRTPTPDAVFTFGDDLVEGDLLVPEGVRVDMRGRVPRTSLVRPRPHYIPEMLKSVENL
ncbi:MAG: hypothetical protein M5U28_27200 [Sandaracinaceae bacterium]|nr:hypothetical protein [Sandaracinaceae bacterium]